jgi:catechol 2,3-dioxygenase-like lactoylglutathione lyase family enzyme
MIRHVASIAEIVEDVGEAVRFYRDVLGLPVEHEPGSDYATVDVGGVLHFGLWSREAAAESVFGSREAAGRIPLGFSVGFEVDEVRAAEQRLTSAGAPPVQARRTEPWGQITARLLSPSGALAEVAETPWARRIVQPLQAAEEDTAS